MPRCSENDGTIPRTRAKDQVFLSWPQFNNGKAFGPSPFLIEMPTLAPLIDDALHAAASAVPTDDEAAAYFADEELDCLDDEI